MQRTKQKFCVLRANLLYVNFRLNIPSSVFNGINCMNHKQIVVLDNEGPVDFPYIQL